METYLANADSTPSLVSHIDQVKDKQPHLVPGRPRSSLLLHTFVYVSHPKLSLQGLLHICSYVCGNIHIFVKLLLKGTVRRYCLFK